MNITSAELASIHAVSPALIFMQPPFRSRGSTAAPERCVGQRMGAALRARFNGVKTLLHARGAGRWERARDTVGRQGSLIRAPIEGSPSIIWPVGETEP